jgi:hypothetical protein
MLSDCDRNRSTVSRTWDIESYSTSRLYYNDNGHQVPSKVARPPLSTTRAMAPRTLSFQDGKPVIPTSPAHSDGRKSSNRSSSITSTRYKLPNCSRGTVIDGRRSMHTTGRRSAASRSETVMRAPCDSAVRSSTSRRTRALHSPRPLDGVFGRGDDGWFARM